jgi:hypothetical protein
VKPNEARKLIWLVPTKVFADLLLSLLHCDFQNVPREHANYTAGTIFVDVLRWTQV